MDLMLKERAVLISRPRARLAFGRWRHELAKAAPRW
jgi:hypothetical protein